MKCRKSYADKEKYRKYRNGYNARYYKRTMDARNKRKSWTEDEINMILKKMYSDHELSDLLGRSVRAIQDKICKMTRPKPITETLI